MTRIGFITSIFLLPWSFAQANPIFFEVDNIVGSTWEYTYTVDNQFSAPIEEFTIFFDSDLYENLVITGSPSLDWDGLAIQPDPLLPDDGFADWLALGLPIDPGETLGGFSVIFEFLGAGTPGSQVFFIIDPLTFDTIGRGLTMPLPGVVSEPATLALFGLGLAGLFVRRTCRDS